MSGTIYCGQCGNANPASNKFCGKCGAELTHSQEKTTSALPLKPPISHSNACPKCKSIDQIRKLSTIVTSGTRTTSGVSATLGETNLAGSQRHHAQGTGYVGSSELSGKAYSASSTLIDATEQSELAKKLASPRKPKAPELERPEVDDWFIAMFGVVALVPAIAGAALLAKPWGIIGGIVGFIVGIAISGFLVIQFASPIFDERREKAEKQFEIEKEKHGKDILAWKKAKQRWETMYYCYRDDIIFVPGENETAIPDQLIGFCYKK